MAFWGCGGGEALDSSSSSAEAVSAFFSPRLEESGEADDQLNPILVHKAKAQLEAERTGKSRLVPGANKSGGLKRLGIGSSADEKLSQEERERKRVDTYLARCEGVAHESGAGTGTGAGAGAKQRAAKEEAAAGVKLRSDLDTRRVSQSLEVSQLQLRRTSIVAARVKAAAVEEDVADGAHEAEYV